MSTVPHPTAVVRERQEQRHVPFGFPVGTVIEPADIDLQSAPVVTPPYTAFAGVGHRPAVVNRSPQTPSIAEWQSVMLWPVPDFQRQQVPLRVYTGPIQGHNPFPERTTFAMPPQTTVGQQSTVQASFSLPVGDASYLRLLGGAG